MKKRTRWNVSMTFAGCWVIAILLTASITDAQTAVMTERLPDDGIQPQVATDADGAVHLLYFRGEAAAGDAYYVRRGPRDAEWGDAIRVNSQPGSVVATGTIRGAQIALGRNDRVHVVWNGSAKAEPTGPANETPLLYTRSSTDLDGFEQQRNLIANAYGLDGGGCVAADSQGHVYVAWHGRGESDGEEARRVYLRTSRDDGRDFGAERPIDVDRAGACGCCGMQGAVTPDGRPMFLYRSAKKEVNRDMYLLTSADAGSTFSSQRLDAWRVDSCPMSSASFAFTPSTAFAAWQTKEQVYVARLGQSPLKATPAPGTGPQRKHPAIAVNERGLRLLVWTEGTGWNKGGSFAWQLYDRNGRPTKVRGKKPGIPAWSFAKPYLRADGVFVILY